MWSHSSVISRDCIIWFPLQRSPQNYIENKTLATITKKSDWPVVRCPLNLCNTGRPAGLCNCRGCRALDAASGRSPARHSPASTSDASGSDGAGNCGGRSPDVCTASENRENAGGWAAGCPTSSTEVRLEMEVSNYRRRAAEVEKVGGRHLQVMTYLYPAEDIKINTK